MTPEPENRHAAARLKQLGELRDGLLVLVSVVYLLGYGVWSIVSWRNGLGPLPLLEAQYLIAGITPAVVLALAAALIWLIRLVFFVRYPAWLERQSTKKLVVLHVALFLLMAAGLVVLLAGESRDLDLVMLAGVALAVIPSLFVQPWLVYDRLIRWAGRQLGSTEAEGLERLYERLAGVARILPLAPRNAWILPLPAVAAAVLLWYYVDWGYTSLPQALGGAAPRCAQVDVAAAELGAGTLDQLGVPADTLVRKGPARTSELSVFFAGSDFLMVKERARSAPGDPVVELPRDHVRAIIWCDSNRG